MILTARSWFPLSLLLATLLTACGGDEQEAAGVQTGKTPIRTTIISTTRVKVRSIEVVEHSVGALESIFVPEVSAEVNGTVLNAYFKAGNRVMPGQLLIELDAADYDIAERGAQAEVAQLEALHANQQQTVKRYTKLVEDKLISTDRYDEAVAQQRALSEQLKAAQERLKQKQRGLTKTRVISAYEGVVDAELASIGDFVEIGDPLVRIIKIDVLRARLPLPETLAPKISKGMEIRLISPLDPDQVVSSTIQEIRPTVGSSNRAIDVLAIIDNPGKWLPGASVSGEIIIETRERAIVVPKAAVVLRPAGRVVYVITNGIAKQRIVKTGEYLDKEIEILSGLEEDEIIAVNGAGFLADGAPVSIADAG